MYKGWMRLIFESLWSSSTSLATCAKVARKLSPEVSRIAAKFTLGRSSTKVQPKSRSPVRVSSSMRRTTNLPWRRGGTSTTLWKPWERLSDAGQVACVTAMPQVWGAIDVDGRGGARHTR